MHELQRRGIRMFWVFLSIIIAKMKKKAEAGRLVDLCTRAGWEQTDRTPDLLWPQRVWGRRARWHNTNFALGLTTTSWTFLGNNGELRDCTTPFDLADGQWRELSGSGWLIIQLITGKWLHSQAEDSSISLARVWTLSPLFDCCALASVKQTLPLFSCPTVAYFSSKFCFCLFWWFCAS